MKGMNEWWSSPVLRPNIPFTTFAVPEYRADNAETSKTFLYTLYARILVWAAREEVCEAKLSSREGRRTYCS
jgi:hypothetical protein